MKNVPKNSDSALLPAFFSAEDSAAARQELSSSREQKHSLRVPNNAGRPSRFKRRLDSRFYTNPKDAVAPAERDHRLRKEQRRPS